MRKETDRILCMMHDCGFTIFTADHKPLNLNIIEERTNNKLNNLFEDKLHVIWKFEGNWEHLTFRCTTKAGTSYMHTNQKWGVKCFGQYRGAYKLDKHSGRYYALCQRLGKVSAYRYEGQPQTIDEFSHIDSGMFGANVHRANYNYNRHGRQLLKVNRWSAMCTVLPFHEDFNIFMQVCKEAANIWGNKFTTTLIQSY